MFKKEIEFIRSLYPEKEFIPLHEPCIIGKEKEYVNQAIDSTFVSSIGKYVDEFENMLCSFTKVKYSVATVNGTCALHAALIGLGLGRGDEVITQPLTFIATTNAIAYCGADPIFLDVDIQTLGLSPDALEDFLENQTVEKNAIVYNKHSGKKIAACLPVHIFGHPCRIDRIVDICDRYNIPVLEDCAESLGSTYKGNNTGTFGACSIFSFNGNKIVTSGGGGAVITNDKKMADRIRHITTTARTSDSQQFIHDEVGFNYRMPNLNAAFLCGQMENAQFFLKNKRQTAAAYKTFFQSSKLGFFTEPEHCVSNYWLNAVSCEDKKSRNTLLAQAQEAGVMVRPVWRLINKLAMYGSHQTDSLKNATWLEERIVNLPSSVRV